MRAKLAVVLNLTPLELFKLAAIETEEFTDEEVKKLFLDLKISSEDDLRIAVAALQLYRPKLLKEISKDCCINPRPAT